MISTTFGYHSVEDRMWMQHQHPDDRVWLTRQHAVYVLGVMAQQVEQTVPGAVTGSPSQQRAQVEHQLAMNESARPRADGGSQALPGLTVGREDITGGGPSAHRLCQTIRTTLTGQGQCLIDFQLTTGETQQLRLDRPSLHRWLKAFWMVAQKTPWNLPVQPPEWLQASLLPEAVQKMLTQPMVDDPAADNDLQQPPPI